MSPVLPAARSGTPASERRRDKAPLTSYSAELEKSDEWSGRRGTFPGMGISGKYCL